MYVCAGNQNSLDFLAYFVTLVLAIMGSTYCKPSFLVRQNINVIHDPEVVIVIVFIIVVFRRPFKAH